MADGLWPAALGPPGAALGPPMAATSQLAAACDPTGSREVYVDQALDAHRGDEPQVCLAGVQLLERSPPPRPEAEDGAAAQCPEALQLQDVAHSVALAVLSMDSGSAPASPSPSPRGLDSPLPDPGGSYMFPGHAPALPPVLGTVGAAPGGRFLP